MRVGILTFHEIHNPGAFWQAFATVQLVRQLGHEPVIINYTSPAHRYIAWRKLFHLMTIKYPRHFLETMGKVKAYRRAQKTLPVTAWLETHADVAGEHFDAVIVGSDIVWDFKTQRLGQDPVYFGKYLNADKLIAYAPSCGSCDAEEPLPDYVTEGLPMFDCISVRDANTQSLIKRVLGIDVPIIGDPTCNLDFKGLAKAPDKTTRYIAIYASGEHVSSEFIDAIKRFARDRNIDVVAVGYRNSWADENFVFVDPFEWLGWLQYADYIATNTFHGTSFSIYLEKPFVTELNPAIGKKTEQLLSDLGLTSRVFDNERPLNEIMTTDWLDDSISLRLKEKAVSARSFLDRALAG